MAKAMPEGVFGVDREPVFGPVSLVATITLVHNLAILQPKETKVIKKTDRRKKSRNRLTFVHEVATFICDKGA